MVRDIHPSVDEPSVWKMAGVILLASISQTAGYLSPFTQVALVKGYGTSEAMASIAISTEIAFQALCVLVISRIIQRVKFRAVIGVAASATLAGQLLTLVAPRYEVLLTARALCGLGEGGCVAITYAVMARANHSVRLFSIQAICLAFILMVIFGCLSLVESAWGPRGQFMTFAVIAAIGLPLSWLVQNRAIPKLESPSERSRKSRSVHWLLSVACVVALGSASNALWLHYENIGEIRQIAVQTLFLIPAIGGVALLGLPVVTMMIFKRVKAYWPLAVASLIQILAAAFYLFVPNQIAFIVSATALNALIGFQLVYARLLGADLDPSGEVVSGVGGGDFAGAFFGPLIGGAFTMSAVGNRSFFLIIVSLFAISGMLALVGDRRRSDVPRVHQSIQLGSHPR